MGAIKSRKKLFTENFLIYGLGGIISKVIPLILVPIITRLMPDSSYYGISDLANTVISFFSAIALLGMYDAMFRMFFEKDDLGYKKDICSSAFTFTLILSVFVSVLMCIFQEPISRLFFSDPQYGYLVMISAISVLVGTTNSIISAPTRMQNKRGTYLIMNTVSPIISYAISIPLLLNGYYLIALPVASACSSVITEISFGIINHEWFSLKRTNWHYVWEMLKIALPLAPNFLIYWIFNSSDRVMIANLLSTSESGVYAVAAKFGHLSQLIYTAFAGGWQYFAFSVMKDKDNEAVVSKVFEVLLIASLTTTMMGTAIAKWGVKILFTEEYWSSYLCIPYLYLSPLLLMLFQIGSNQFLVIKKTWPNIVILGVGAALNVALNFVLIPVIGIEGASLATFIGYFVSIVIMAIALKKMKLMYIRAKTLIYSAMFLVGFGVMRIFDIAKWYVNLIVLVLFLVLTILLYWKDYSKYLYFRKRHQKENVSDDNSSGKNPDAQVVPSNPEKGKIESDTDDKKE